MAQEYRIVICVDIVADNASKAYEKLYDTMMASELAWESTDEWFSEDSAQAMSEEDCAAARAAFFERRKTPHEL